MKLFWRFVSDEATEALGLLKIVLPSLGVSIEILHVAGKKVRIGIEAPQEVPVHRGEVAERIFREKLRQECPK